jgi:hypothetical protein
MVLESSENVLPWLTLLFDTLIEGQGKPVRIIIRWRGTAGSDQAVVCRTVWVTRPWPGEPLVDAMVCNLRSPYEPNTFSIRSSFSDIEWSPQAALALLMLVSESALDRLDVCWNAMVSWRPT